MCMRTTMLFLAAAGLAFPPLHATARAADSKRNVQIAEGLREISAKNIEATIRKLVSFGTRHTLSSQTDPKRGIGASLRWAEQEFRRYSKACGSCLTG